MRFFTKMDNNGVMIAVSCMSDQWHCIKQKVCVAMLLCNNGLTGNGDVIKAIDALNECQQAFKSAGVPKSQDESNLFYMVQTAVGDRLLALREVCPEWNIPHEGVVFQVKDS